ncbi:hypothetical protein TWF718_005013 [Orbilia javanica]|uniref:Uncharacterized protein n=1 Tax=Orbilia javanica TaxID=47235 RepID=A0AAN8N6R7_9PEZI
MKTFFTTILLGIFAITTYARDADVETTSTKLTTHTPTTLSKTSSTTSAAARPTCDVRMFRIDCPETPDPCCTRLCIDPASSGLFCADDWEDVGEGVQCESCVQTTTTSSSESMVPTGVSSYAGSGNNVTTTTASLPEPTFSSEASGARELRIGGAAAVGLLGLLFAI